MTARTIPQVIEAAAERFGTGEALVDGDLRLDWVQLAAAADEAARALIASGIERGDRVAIWAPNISEWVIAALGIHRAGAVVVTINTRFKGNEALHVLAHRRGPDALHRHRLPRHRLRGACSTRWAGPPALAEVVVHAGSRRRRTWRGPTSSPAPPTSPPRPARARAAEVEPGDMSDIVFTSGTTGAPKGAMLAHEAGIRAYTAWSDVVGLQRGRPLPHRQPVLPLLRAEGRHPRLPAEGGDDRAPPGLRRAERDATGRRGAHLDAAGPAGGVPDDPRPPRPRRASTCRPCAWRSPAPRRCPSR